MLLHGILGVIGISSGCAGRSVSDGTTEGADSDETESAESGDGDGDGDMPLDMPDETDTGNTSECGPFVDSWELVVDVPVDCGEPYPGEQSQLVCFFAGAGSTCEQAGYTQACILDGYSCGWSEVGDAIKCGPLISAEGACCYVVVGECLVGRPFCVDGRARVAELRIGPQWADAPRPRLDRLDAPTRAALADFWSQLGASEHASVASFARFTTQLIALGAPARLVAGSLRAGFDERTHALRCLGLAHAYASVPTHPGALAVHECLAEMDVVEIATSLASEGCVAETVSLMLLIAAHEQAKDESVRAVLHEMIADEHRHVLLAWGALRWLCERHGPIVHDAVARVFATPEQHVGFGARTQLPGDEAQMRAHGYLTIEARREVAIAALAQIVAPAAARLLAQSSGLQPFAGPSDSGGSINSGSA